MSTENYFLGRVDYTLSSKDTLFARVVSDWSNFDDPTSGSTIPTWGDQEGANNLFTTIEERHNFTNNLVNSARITYARVITQQVPKGQSSGLSFLPGEQDGTIDTTGLSEIGTVEGVPGNFLQDGYRR